MVNTESELKKMKVAELKDIIRDLKKTHKDLTLAGNKAELIAKIKKVQKRKTPSSPPTAVAASSPPRATKAKKATKATKATKAKRVSVVDDCSIAKKKSCGRKKIADLQALAARCGVESTTGLTRKQICDAIAGQLGDTRLPEPAPSLPPSPPTVLSPPSPMVDKTTEPSSTGGAASLNREEALKKKLADIKQMLADKNIHPPYPRAKKDVVDEYLLGESCSPPDNMCSQGRVCEVRADKEHPNAPGVCVSEAFSKAKKWSEMTVGGKKIIGSAAAIATLKQKIQDAKNKTVEVTLPAAVNETILEEVVEDDVGPSSKQVIHKDDDLNAHLKNIRIEEDDEVIPNITEIKKKVLQCLGITAPADIGSGGFLEEEIQEEVM